MLHPVSVCFLLSCYKESKKLEELMVAALLHDTLEDTDATFTEIAEAFSPLVASLVLELTSDPDEIAQIGKNPYLTKKMIGMSSYALVIKLADRLSNILDAPTDAYRADTAEMLDALEDARNLSGSQKALVDEIRAHL